MDRRSFIRGSAAAIVAAPALDLQRKLAMHGATSIGGHSDAQPEQASGGSEQKKFKNFADWWKEYGADGAEGIKTQSIYQFDPDLMDMRSISLQAKVSMQRNRNYEAHKKNLMKRFARDIAKHGFFGWWE